VRPTPDRDAFIALTVGHSMVPVRLEVVADRYTPVALFERLAGDGPAFLFESVEGGERWGRWSFVGWDPLFVVETGADGSVISDVGTDLSGLDPLQALETLVGAHRTPGDPGLPPLHSGLVGYLGYDAVRYIEHLPDRPQDDRDLPLMSWQAVGARAAFDHLRQRVMLLRNVIVSDADPGTGYDDAIARLGEAVAALEAPGPVATVSSFDLAEPIDASPTLGREAFMSIVRSLKEHIAAGDAFQVVPSVRFDVKDVGDPFAVYRALRLSNPSPYMFFLRTASATIVGSSPELMVRVRDGKVSSRPIAGTRPRGGNDAEDAALEAELRADEKERAEHVMLVDLARNDVGRVARYGTVSVDELMVVERYSHVMHLVSAVSGDLRDGVTAVDVLRATFPHGTVTGAPKVAAMQLIDQIEPTARGPYAGAVGYVDFSGNLDTAIALRTLITRGGAGWVQAGAGVVADSDPAAEYEECRAKAAAVLAAIAAARHV
jgi:anthranilate synthase component 1